MAQTRNNQLQYIVALIAAVAVLTSVGLYQVSNPQNKITLGNIGSTSSFNTFKKWSYKHGKTYLTPEEELFRFKVFRRNKQLVESHSQLQATEKPLTYRVGLNQFSDLSTEEFRARYLQKINPELLKDLPSETEHPEVGNHRINQASDNPLSIDWRLKGAIDSIEEISEKCPGSAYSSVGKTVIQALFHIYWNINYDFSKQEIIDCSRGFGNKGCKSGFWGYVLHYAKIFGLSFSQNYPFTGQEGPTCQIAQKLKKKKIKIGAYIRITSKRGDTMEDIVAEQPIAASIHGDNLQFYQGGIFNGYCGIDLNHQVAIVGYGSELGVKFWIVKNTWGQYWGERGYLRIIKTVKKGAVGKCGINLLVGYPYF